MTKIQLKRGLEKDLPVLAIGEPAFTTDSGKLFIGSPSGNVQILSNGGITGIASPNAQSWISTDSQDTFTVTNGYISNTKSLIVFVDGIIQPDTTLLNSSTFKLPEPLEANIDVYAMWFEVSSSNGSGGGGQQTSYMPNSYSWVATDAQDTFQISSGAINDIRLLNVYVGGVIQPNITLIDSKTFKLPEALSAGVNVYAEWFETMIPITSGTGGSLANEYEWTATEGQLTYILPTNTTYDTNSKWFDVYVGGAIVSPSLVRKDNSSQFTLLCSISDINAGMKVLARWTEPYIPSSTGHHTTHEMNGSDEIDVTKLKNYSNYIQIPINVLIGLNDYSTQYTYTASGNISTEIVKDNANNVISSTTYNYDGTGKLTTIIFIMNGTTVTSTYNYDGSGNLTSVTNVKS